MKHPLTSKERRGLVAVAAAALLCVGSGFIFRSCSAPQSALQSVLQEAPQPPKGGVVVVDNDSIAEESVGSEESERSEKSERSGKSEQAEKSDKSYKSDKCYQSDKSGKSGKNGKRSRRAKRQKAEKTYPTRSPLDEPCD